MKIMTLFPTMNYCRMHKLAQNGKLHVRTSMTRIERFEIREGRIRINCLFFSFLSFDIRSKKREDSTTARIVWLKMSCRSQISEWDKLARGDIILTNRSTFVLSNYFFLSTRNDDKTNLPLEIRRLKRKLSVVASGCVVTFWSEELKSEKTRNVTGF